MFESINVTFKEEPLKNQFWLHLILKSIYIHINICIYAH